MKKYHILILFIAGFTTVQAQQTIRFSNYLFNKMIVNPAAAGSNEYIEAMASYRKQWTGFNGSPQTNFFSVDGSAFSKRLGLGLQVVNDRLGALSQTGVMGNVAGRVRLGEDRFLSLGVSTGFFKNTLDGNDLTYKDQNETVIPTSTRSIHLVDFKTGVFYKDLTNFFGVSVFNIVKPTLNYEPQGSGELGRHYYFFGGHVFTFTEDYAIIPSILYKTNGTGQDQFDFNAKFAYRTTLAVGLLYRNQESFGVMAEYIWNNTLRFGYAYDFSTNELNGFHGGSHEVMAAYRIVRNKEIITNPRYFYNN